ncbi:peptidyl-prolyl cis-trans isomerase B-like [Lineus longissimus]|uniref:peptidyl-prolyl cis-trans isomerase B-like n=1 Tax=Lineus longissimus TaxID=88925 RepID=UPI002B4E4ED5
MQTTTIVTILLGVFAAAYAEQGNYTVTDEAWFDVEIKDLDGKGEDYRGRFVIAVFGETCPVTRLNFVSLVKGHTPVHPPKRKLSYKNTPIHRIVADFVIQMGDITIGDGTGGTSIYGDRFNDEKFTLSHRSPGWVAMANHGKNTNGSQFFILLSRARWLDNKHIVFGKVIRGMKTVETVGNVKANPDTAVPETKVTIVDCGLNKLEKPYDLSGDDLDSTEDL